MTPAPGTPFTGERLHEGNDLFALDLARHQAAYELACGRAGSGRVADLGCGSGYGTASLARAGVRVVGIDRVAPDRAHRGGPTAFLRSDLEALPFATPAFDLVVSFQVIEHLSDPRAYLGAIAALLRPGGSALLTTPNHLTSDGVNPYHVHEYVSDELAELLRGHFDDVEMRGIGASETVRAQLEARSRRIRHILRLDPLGLRERLPRPLVEWLFARFAVLVRRLGRGRDPAAEIDWRDFPVGAAAADCLDLLAICRGPRAPA